MRWLLMFLAACGSDRPATPDECLADGPTAVVAQISRGPCFGYCPVYRVAVRQDGMLEYDGIDNVQELGIRTGTVDANTLAQLKLAFLDADFYAWDDLYVGQIPDLPSLHLSFLCNGNAKTVDASGGGAPPEMVDLAARFDVLVDIEQYIGVQP